MFIPHHISTFTLAFCGAVEFFSLFSLLKKKIHLKIFFFFSYKRHSLFPLHISTSKRQMLVRWFGVFLFVFVKKKKEKNSFKNFFSFSPLSLFFPFFLMSFLDFIFYIFHCFSHRSLPTVTIPEYI